MAIVRDIYNLKDITERQVKIDMSDVISLLKPSDAPINRILTEIKNERQAINPKFEWLEDTYVSCWGQVNMATGFNPGSNSGTVTLDDATRFSVNDLLKVPSTGDVWLVTAYINDTQLTVRRWDNLTANISATANNAAIVKIGNAVREGADPSRAGDMPTAIFTQTVPLYNYVQHFITPIKISDRVEQSEMYGQQGNRKYQHIKKGEEHNIDLERAILFGTRQVDTAVGRYTTGGILTFVTSNVIDVSAIPGGFNEITFIKTISRTIFKYGSKKKFAFCGAVALAEITSWAQDKIRISPDTKRYGLEILEYITPFGTLNLIYHPLLEGYMEDTTESIGYGGYMIILDMENLTRVFAKNGKTKLILNQQPNGARYVLDEYETYMGLELRLEKTHTIIKGIS